MLLDRRNRLDPLIVLALRAGLQEVVAHQIRKDVQVDARDSKGRTALMIAAEFGHAEICRLLLFAGANPTLRDAAGSTACDLARERGYAFSLEMLAAPPDSTVSTSPHAMSASIADENFGWEPEEEAQVPADNLDCRLYAEDLQRQIGAHGAKDVCEDWANIALELPPAEEVCSISAPAVSGVILAGLSSGRIFSEEIEAACEADFNEQAGEVLPHLIRLLEGLELVIEETPLDEPLASRRVDPGDEWLIAEILQCLAGALPRKSMSDHWGYSALMYPRGNDFIDGQSGESTLSGMLMVSHVSRLGYYPSGVIHAVEEWPNGLSD